MTGANAATPYHKPSMRALATGMIPYLQMKNVQRGRPARELRLPMDWSKVGAYSLQVNRNGVSVLMRRLSICRALPPQVLSRVRSAKHLELWDNFSEQSAMLREEGRPFGYSVVTLFPEAGSSLTLMCPVVPEVGLQVSASSGSGKGSSQKRGLKYLSIQSGVVPALSGVAQTPKKKTKGAVAAIEDGTLAVGDLSADEGDASAEADSGEEGCGCEVAEEEAESESGDADAAADVDEGELVPPAPRVT